MRRIAGGLVLGLALVALPSTGVAHAVGTAPQSPLVVTNTTLTGTVGTPITVVPGGGSGNGATSIAVSGIGCTVSGLVLSASQPGTCAVWVVKEGTTTYARASSPAVRFTFSGQAQSALTITNSSTTGYVGTPITLVASGGTGSGAVSFAVTGAGCAVSGAQLSATQAATCQVTAIRAASGAYIRVSSATVAFTFIVASPDGLRVTNSVTTGVAGTPITLTSTTGSGSGALTFATSGIGCSVSGSALVATQPGICAAWVIKAADATYPRVTSPSVRFTFSAETQHALSISNSLAERTGVAGTPLPVTTTGGDGSGAVTLSAIGTGCSIIGLTVKATSSPTCIVTATKAASGIYARAASAPVTFTFTGIAQAAFAISNGSRTTPADSTFTLTTAGGSGSGAVTYSVTGTGCSVSGAVLSTTRATTCTVTATKAASGAYGAATSNAVVFTFAGLTQSPLSITNETLTGEAGTAITVTTDGGSGTGAESLVVVGAGCSLSGTSLSANQTTICTVTAAKAASGVYARATSAPVQFVFTAQDQATLLISNTTLTGPADTPITVTTSGGSGTGAVTYSVVGAGCSIAGAALQVTQPTTCRVTAYKAASGVFGPAASAERSFTFTAASQAALAIS
ncbi:MAG: hypothetical protein WCG77_07670, partial [Actinomycetes bacterium]